MPPALCNIESAPPFPVATERTRHWVGTRLKQALYDAGVSPVCAVHQSGPSLVVKAVHSRTAVEQNHDYWLLALGRCPGKRGAPSWVNVVTIGARGQECRYLVGIPSFHGTAQGPGCC